MSTKSVNRRQTGVPAAIIGRVVDEYDILLTGGTGGEIVARTLVNPGCAGHGDVGRPVVGRLPAHRRRRFIEDDGALA